MKSVIRKLVPRHALAAYHLALAWMGAILYGFPSRHMVIIGVTGTRGKTTTANYIWSILRSAGYKVGLTGTANIRINDEEQVNRYHMTMPGRFVMQSLLNKMRRAGCEIAIVETPSEGVEQFRHKGIDYDIVVFATLYPEYLAVHNWDFERCKRMMEEIFVTLSGSTRKKLRGSPVPKTIIVNKDAEGYQQFLCHTADHKITYGITSTDADIVANEIIPTAEGVRFNVAHHTYTLQLPGSFNVRNALAALAVGSALGINTHTIGRGLNALGTVPGRMEPINAGQTFRVFVDYAHDGPSIEALLSAGRTMRTTPDERIIVLLGAEGGGRDIKKRPVMGELAAKLADYVVISNVDPYDDDPQSILDAMVTGVEKRNKIRDTDFFVIADRREGIRKAFALARKNDLVFLTGKGAEQAMVIKGKTMPWDDRTVAREELIRLMYHT